MTRRLLLACAFLASACVAGCDSGPKGPGTLSATVLTDQTLGAVVLEFNGGSVTGFEGQGSTRVFASRTNETGPTFRVILVSPDGSPLRFGIQVSDLDAARPAVTAITGASTDNASMDLSGLQIKIEN